MRVVVDLVEHTVITDADSERTGLRDDGPYAVRSGIVGQAINRGGYPFSVRSVYVG